MIKAFSLFFLTAVAEIVGCWLIMKWAALEVQNPILKISYLTGAVLSLFIFAYMLTLHPTDSGRVYATYGGAYVFTALLWLWVVDKVTPTPLDLIGVGLVLTGSFVIASQYLLKGN